MGLDLPAGFRVGIPSDEFIEEGCEDGLPENLSFHWVERPSLAQCLEVFCIETKALDLVHERGGTEADVEWPDDELFEDEGYGFYLCDCGVAGLVAAVRLVGGVTLTSCAGAKGHLERHPTVVFWAERDAAELIHRHAIAAGVEWSTAMHDNNDPRDGRDLFVLVSRTGLRPVRRLAIDLMRSHAEASTPPMAAALAEASALAEESPLPRP